MKHTAHNKKTRPIVKAVLIFLVLLAVVFLAGTYVFLRVRGRALLAEHLAQAVRLPVRIGEVRFAFPSGFSIDDVAVGNILTAKKVSLQVSPLSLITENVHLYSAHFFEPVLIVERGRDGKIAIGGSEHPPGPSDAGTPDAPQPAVVSAAAPAGTPAAGPGAGGGFAIGKVVVRDGTLRFFDRFSPRRETILTIEDVDIVVRNLRLPPRSQRIPFKCSGSFGGYGALSDGGEVRAGGWVDWVKKDMEGELRVIDTGGSASMTADIVSKNNDMHVAGNLRIKRLTFRRGAIEDSTRLSFDDVIFGALQSTGAMGKGLSVSFSFETKMDDFRIDRISFSGAMRE